MHPANEEKSSSRFLLRFGFVCCLAGTIHAASPVPDGAGPITNRVARFPDSPRLSWTGFGENLLVNGGFESGSLEGWEQEGPAGKLVRTTTIPNGGTTSASVFNGRYSVTFLSGYPGPLKLSQVVALPSTATNAVLSWVELVRNDAPRYAPPDHSFRVEVQTPDGFPLAVLQEYSPGDPLRSPWSRRSASVGQFAGQTVRLAFIESDTLGPMTVNLDDIRLEAAAPAGTRYQVLFAAGSAPTPTDRLGESAAPSLPMPPLLPDTAYSWQVLTTDAEGTHAGPVWSFRTGTNGPAARLKWNWPEGPVQQDQPLAAGLEARSEAGLPVVDYAGTAEVAGVILDGRPSSLVISEVSLPYGVEFLNTTPDSLDLSGWEVSLYDSTTWPRPRTVFVFPPGASIASGKVVMLRRNGTAPGSGPTFYTGQPLQWGSLNQNREIAVLLRNRDGGMVDFFCADRALPAAITEPARIPSAEWIGRPAPRPSFATDSFSRLGRRDRQLASDWLDCVDSFGQVNPFGVAAFLPGVAVTPMDSSGTAALVAGRWTGSLSPPFTGEGRLFLADDRNGRIAWSPRVDVLAAPAITLEIRDSWDEGSSGTLIVHLPEVRTDPVVLTLASSLPTRFSVPAQVALPAGSTEVTVPLQLVQDSQLQGEQTVTLEVTAPGYARARRSITLVDDEVTTLGLELPATVLEGAAPSTGYLTLASAAAADVEVQLAASVEGQLVLPKSLRVPAGQTRIPFPLGAINDPRIDGDVEVAVTAQSGNWTAATQRIIAADNEDRRLRWVLPSRLRGTNAVDGQIQLSGILPNDLDLALIPGEAGILSVPATVRIPAGATNVVFPVQAIPSETFRGGDAVSVVATSPGFEPATVWCEVWDEQRVDVTLAATDLVLHPGWERLLAIVAARDVAHPNELVVVNPYTGEIERSVPVAAEPVSLAVSDDGKVAWVGSSGESRVQRIDLETFSVTDSFSLEGGWPLRLIARRDRTDSVIVYRYQSVQGRRASPATPRSRFPIWCS